MKNRHDQTNHQEPNSTTKALTFVPGRSRPYPHSRFRADSTATVPEPAQESPAQPNHVSRFTPHDEHAIRNTQHVATAISQPYVLKKGLGYWQLLFNNETAYFKHEQGAAYVAYLLLHPPPEPIHGLDLATRIAALSGKQKGVSEIIDPASGQRVTLSADARIQERSPELDRAATMRLVLRKQEELEALLEDEDQIEPVKVEAQRELIALYNYEKAAGKRVRDSAQKAAHAVGMAIKRFHRHLASARDPEGLPHPVLRPFADHIHKYLLLPSGRYLGAGRSRTRASLPGCFTYQPPAGTVWKS